MPPYTYLWSTGETTPSITVCPDGDPGITTFEEYSVSVTDSKGITGSAKVIVNIVDVRCGTNNDKVLICKNQDKKKPVSSCISPNAVAAQLKNGATLGSCRLKQGLEEAGDLVLEPEMKIYPNPSDGVINMLLKDIGNEELRITIRDVLGRVVLEEFHPSSAGHFSKSFLVNHSGIYFISVSSENVMFSKQFSVIR